jgi:IS30 family transposase
MHRTKSAIWYELQKKRKGKPYNAEYAHHLSYVRRRNAKVEGKKIAMHKELRTFVEHHLMDDQSPENLSLRIKNIEKHLPYVSATTIRRYIKSPYGRKIESHRATVFKKRRRGRPPRQYILDKRMIDQRPSKINKRWGLGHFEGDFIVSGRSGKGMVLGLRDRKVRKCLLERILPVSVRAVERALVRMKKRYPEMQSVTFDNDILFLEHKRLEKVLGIKIYFCHVHSPWEKPGIENLNKDLRRYIPKSSDISKYSVARLKKLEAKMNRRFMEVLGSLTPNEAYEKEKKKRTQRGAEKGRSN